MIPTLFEVCPGVRLRAVRTDRFKSGMLAVSITLPIDRETTPLTTLLLSVLRRGTVKYPTLCDINRRLDYLYGTELAIRNFYRGDKQIIGFSAELLDPSYLPGACELTADVLDVMTQILFHPLLDENGLLYQSYTASEQQMQCDAIRAQRNEPRAYASDRARALLYENEPCGTQVLGNEEQIASVTPKALTAHWKALIDAPSFDCFYVGASDPEKIAAALADALGGYAKASKEPLSLAPVLRRAEQVRTREEDFPATQGHLILSYRTDASLWDAHFYSCALLNELLGNSPVSRLFVYVREKKSLCYFCTSHYSAHKGTLTVHCGLDPENRATAEAEIKNQIDAIRRGDFTDAELEAAKQSIKAAYRRLSDSPAALESFYFSRALAGVDADIDESLARFARLTRADIQKAAHRLTLDSIYFLNATLREEE